MALKGALVERAGLALAGPPGTGQSRRKLDPLAVVGRGGGIRCKPLAVRWCCWPPPRAACRAARRAAKPTMAACCAALALHQWACGRKLAGLAPGHTAWWRGTRAATWTVAESEIGDRWAGGRPLPCRQLRFRWLPTAPLRDYERGYVKEGVGAAGLALLWELSGRRPEALAEPCDLALEQLQGCCLGVQAMQGAPPLQLSGSSRRQLLALGAHRWARPLNGLLRTGPSSAQLLPTASGQSQRLVEKSGCRIPWRGEPRRGPRAAQPALQRPICCSGRQG